VQLGESMAAQTHYTKDHEWITHESGQPAIVGLTKFAAKQLGDVVFVELPEVGRVFSTGEPVGTVESVKAVSEFFAPVGGAVTAVNEELNESPEDINEDAEGSAWLFRLQPDSSASYDGLLDRKEYDAYIAEEG
jgi:glycine cleavage system H protein